MIWVAIERRVHLGDDAMSPAIPSGASPTPLLRIQAEGRADFL